MHRGVVVFAFASLACLSFGKGGGSSPAMAADDCRAAALGRLQAYSPRGFDIYRQVRQPNLFEGWIDCADPQFDLPTAVHETTHVIAADTDAFPLLDGGTVDRPHEVTAFFPPSRIADRFGRDDFTTTYLRAGQASSSDDLLYLLDELNAYTHDLATAVDLKAFNAPDEAVDHRDGLAAVMAFVAVYARTAAESQPDTWAGLRRPGVARTVAALWGQAERVMASSCGIPRYGSGDKAYLRVVCASASQVAVEAVIGRAPVCPTACLGPDEDDTQAELTGLPDHEPPEALIADPPPIERTAARSRHPFNVVVGPARHRLPTKAGLQQFPGSDQSAGRTNLDAAAPDLVD